MGSIWFLESFEQFIYQIIYSNFMLLLTFLIVSTLSKIFISNCKRLQLQAIFPRLNPPIDNEQSPYLIVMYDSNAINQERIIIGKKAIDIDNDGPTNKKAQKNKRKKQNKNIQQQAEIEEFQNSKPISNKQPLTKQQKQTNMVNHLKTYTSCSESLIRQKLIEANYNMELAVNLILSYEESSNGMLDLFDKDIQKKLPVNENKNSYKQNQSKNHKLQPQKYPSNHKVEEQAYKLINEMYDKSEIQISGFEFEQLFNEITEIIKEDQKEKGRGVFEINNFVQTCMTAKDAILVGLKDVFFKVEAEIQFDQNDPVHVQLQNFIYEDTQRQVQQEVINKQEFPTLGESSKKKNTSNNQSKGNKKQEPVISSIVNQLQNEHRHTNGPIRKEDLFRPENYRPVIFTEKNSIFNVDNQQKSEDAMRDLHKEYNHVSIQTLKIVYLTLDKNFHQSRTFLERYYPKSTAIKKVSLENNSPKKLLSQEPLKKHLLSGFRAERIEEIDRQLQRWTLSELRSEIEHLYNLRQVFHMTLKNINNSKQRQELIRIANDRAPESLINKLSKASRVKLIEQTMRINPNYVDLHGYREEQVAAILQGIIASIRENFDRGNERVKHRSVGGKTQAIVQIMTGKGRHSHYGKSILKPCVKHWCQKHDIRANVNEDNVEIFVPLV